MQFKIFNSATVLMAALAATATAIPATFPARHVRTLAARQTTGPIISMFLHANRQLCDDLDDIRSQDITEQCGPVSQADFTTFDFDNIDLQGRDCRVGFSSSPTCDFSNVSFVIAEQFCFDRDQFNIGSELRFVRLECN